MTRPAFLLGIAVAGLLVSCESVCGCPPELPPAKVIYGRVETAAGIGVPTAVVLYRFAIDTNCAFDDGGPAGEIDVGAGGWFRGEVYETGKCLELRAFDPAAGKTDTTFSLLLTDFANSDSVGAVLRLP
jgi:hypothetical protein